MKILQIGCGGIGSYLIQEICECIEQEQIDSFNEITIADNDLVELKQKNYQNFKLNEIGKNKAKVLAKRFKDFGIKAIEKRIEKEEQLEGYDLIILCVDNEKTREMIIRYAHKHNKEFIDLHSKGRDSFAMPKRTSLEGNLKFIDIKDSKEYSCQDEEDLERGWINKGNKIIAMVGIQMLLNHTRGRTNKIQIIGV